VQQQASAFKSQRPNAGSNVLANAADDAAGGQKMNSLMRPELPAAPREDKLYRRSSSHAAVDNSASSTPLGFHLKIGDCCSDERSHFNLSQARDLS
jgi:hypothetical protein